MVAPNTGLLTDALAEGKIDAAFMPVDEERKKRLDLARPIARFESTYMVTAASGIKTLAEVDRAGVRVVGIANTTTIRASGRTLKNTTATAAASIDDALTMLHAGQADAFAMGRDSLSDFVKMFPGARIVDGGFQQTVIAIAVPKGRPAALAYVTKFLEEARPPARCAGDGPRRHAGFGRRALAAAVIPGAPKARARNPDMRTERFLDSGFAASRRPE